MSASLVRCDDEGQLCLSFSKHSSLLWLATSELETISTNSGTGTSSVINMNPKLRVQNDVESQFLCLKCGINLKPRNLMLKKKVIVRHCTQLMWSPNKRFCTLWWWHEQKPSSCNVLHTYVSWNSTPKGNSAFICMWSLVPAIFRTQSSPSCSCSYFVSTHETEPNSCRVLYTFWEVWNCEMYISGVPLQQTIHFHSWKCI